MLHKTEAACTQRMKLISFSGIDGAGKSTQIEALTNWLAAGGLHVNLLTFWDDVVVWSRFREGMSHKVFRGDKGIGSPEKPLNRRDKNVTSWPVTAVRLFLYSLDALNLARKAKHARSSGADVVVFDRYIYDELANLPLDRWITRTFVRFLLKVVPTPDVAYVIDADPQAARRRKPEYPLDFIVKNREAYLKLSRLARNIIVIEPLPITAAESKVREMFLQNLSQAQQFLARMPAIP